MSNAQVSTLNSLTAGQILICGGNLAVTVDEETAEKFQPGDHLYTTQLGELVHVEKEQIDIVSSTINKAKKAFSEMGEVSQESITLFFETFADLLADDEVFSKIKAANDKDCERAKERGRSTVRLVLSEIMRKDMIAGLRGWAQTANDNDTLQEVDHEGWKVSLHKAPLGIIAFVFEGRPNVFADACGVLRSHNSVVMRIGSDALQTAKAIMQYALTPALKTAGLPEGAVGLIDSKERSAGYALVANQHVGLVVVRGSGSAVRMLGDVARSAGNQVSLHGRGGAWVIVNPDADSDRVTGTIWRSLDRKVCNTLNTLVLIGDDHINDMLEGLKVAQEKANVPIKLHLHQSAEKYFDDSWREEVPISRAQGDVVEPQSEPIKTANLGNEWEWEYSPEISVVVADTLKEAVALLNEHSPSFVVSLLSENQDTQNRFANMVDAPFVGNDFTRWVDGQYALDVPELGLGNWENGRLLNRGGLLTGAGVYSVQTRAQMNKKGLHR